MEEVKIIYPDMKNLKGYFNCSEDVVLKIKAEGVRLKSDFFDDEFYVTVAEKFEKIAKDYFIYGHYNELLYLICSYNENMVHYEDTLMQNYEDDRKSKEVANFLLAFKRNENVEEIQLAIKDTTGTHSIKDNDISQWMCRLISDAVESGNTPIGIFGETLYYHLYGTEIKFGEKIGIEKLEIASKIKLKTPKVLKQKIIVKFYQYLKPYLEDNTYLITRNKSALTNIQAEFFFDLFNILGLLSTEDAKPTKAKYMRTIIKNNQ